MKGIGKYSVVVCLFLFIASASFAQMYTVTDITPPGSESEAFAINNRGRVVGEDRSLGGFRTAPNSPMNPATDLLGMGVRGLDINDSGQVAGFAWSGGYATAFMTAPNSLVPVPLGGPGTYGEAINGSGQVAINLLSTGHSFRTAANSSLNPATDDLGALTPGASNTYASRINDAGQVVGASGSPRHAFRTAPNRPISPATDDLGTLGGPSSGASGINAFGQVVGVSDMAGVFVFPHVFRTAPNRPINPVTDDLGTGAANAINDYGEVVGQSSPGGCFDSVCYDNFGHYQPFLYSSDTMHDLNKLIPPVGPNCQLGDALDVNNSGQIAANVICDLDDGSFVFHAVLLTPVYKAFVRPPIKADGSSVFSAKRGVLPVKFALTKNQTPTCQLPAATIAITKATGGNLIAVRNSMYLRSNLGSRFRIDLTACQYIYDLPTSGLGVGVYRVDISINQLFVGHAVFKLR